MPTRMIGLFGAMRSGKDTVASILIQEGYDVVRFAFGDALKQNFHSLFQSTPWDPKPIAGYIKYGQMCREIDPDVWVNLAMQDFDESMWLEEFYGKRDTVGVFTDVRQWNEYNAIKERGGVMIKIVTHQHQQVERMEKLGEETSSENLNASTEKEMDQFPFDYIIANVGTEEELRKTVIELAELLKLPKQEGER